MRMHEMPRNLNEYLNVELECGCGRTHYAPIKAVRIGAGVLNELPEIAERFGYRRAFIVCDSITYKIAGQRCEQLMQEKGIHAVSHIIIHQGFDETTLGELLINMPRDSDLIIAVGTGSISDMVRYMSYKVKLPCFTVATAAPMDGFAASVGILNVNNLKATIPAQNTEVIIGDTDILEDAPYRMTIAGFGDLIGKLSCLNDWTISHTINGEHYCEKIAALVKDCVEKVISDHELIEHRDPQALGRIMNGLVLSGTAISLYGNSRPASGAEHHMSHYWEILGEQRGKPYAMHGEQVAVGTVLALMVNEELCKMEIDFQTAREHAKKYDAVAWKKEVQRVYGNASEAIIELEANAGKNDPAGCLQRIDVIEEHWEEIKAQMSKLYPSCALRILLKNLGCPCDPKDIGIDREILKDTFMYCKETRARYTVYQLAWDLGVLEEVADRVIGQLETLRAI